MLWKRVAQLKKAEVQSDKIAQVSDRHRGLAIDNEYCRRCQCFVQGLVLIDVSAEKLVRHLPDHITTSIGFQESSICYGKCRR